MKKIIYIFAAVFIFASTQSCKRISDEIDGDLLINLGANQGGLTGARFLHQETNSVDTLAHYNYNGKKLVEVIGKKSKTNIIYNGELFNKVTHYEINGADSLFYTQYFTYDVTAKYITSISEVGSNYKAYKAVTPGPVEKYKKLHNFEYTPEYNLKSVTSRTGAEIPGAAFEYTSYVKNAFTLNTAKTNVIKVVRDVGPYAGGVFGPAAAQDVFDYTDYDEKINPHTLLPFGYKASAMLRDTGKYNWFSANNPKTITISTELNPVPTVLTTNYTYDAQNYMLSGFGVNYDYRPF